MSSRTMMTAMRSAGTGRIIAGRSFMTSARLNLKESTSQSDVDYDKHKQDSLKKQKAGAGHWKPELASDSEEAIKADRNTESGPEHTQKLQERTKAAAEETRRTGTSTKDHM